MAEENIVLKMRGVKKSFGATWALKGVDLDIREHEVHAIVGSNGAGKSTLMKVLAGEHIPDEGELYYQGENITGMVPRQIQSRGIEVVHQVLNIVNSMSVMENILLSSLSARHGFLTWKEGEARVKEVLDYIGISLDYHRIAGTLSISEQQFVILARAIINRPRVLVLDEPTSRIGMEETKKLFALVKKLKESGTTTIYISHRMEEIYQICDKISVFRDGTRVDTRRSKDFPEDQLVSMMLGKKLEAFFPKTQVPIGESVLEVRNLQYQDKVRQVSFDVKKGEIVSLVGAVGAGKTEIVNSVFGILRPDGGSISIDGEPVGKGPNPGRAIRRGIALVPEDRALQGMIGEYSIRNNVTSIDMKNISRHQILDFKKEKELAREMNDRLMVRPNNIEYRMQSLSGGNQQKVVIGKWLIDQYKIYLLDEVAAGVDVGAKSEIYRLLGELAAKGAGVLLATGDIEEAMGLSDRIIVLYKGRVAAQVRPEDVTKDEILTLIMGGGSSERQEK